MNDSGFELMRHAIWDDLVAKGFAIRRNGSALSGGDPLYYLTDSGREAALDGIVYKTRWGYGKPKNP